MCVRERERGREGERGEREREREREREMVGQRPGMRIFVACPLSFLH